MDQLAVNLKIEGVPQTPLYKVWVLASCQWLKTKAGNHMYPPTPEHYYATFGNVRGDTWYMVVYHCTLMTPNLKVRRGRGVAWVVDTILEPAYPMSCSFFHHWHLRCHGSSWKFGVLPYVNNFKEVRQTIPAETWPPLMGKKRRNV